MNGSDFFFVFLGFIVPGFLDATQHWKKRKHLENFKNKN
jgi:hypothetical protein